MNNLLRISLLSFFLSVFSVLSASAQNLNLNELIACLTAKNYPGCLFEMVEAKGFYRVDKQYFEYCDRVVYALKKGDKPTMFVNPTDCTRPVQSAHFPVRMKNEVELQFQKSSLPQFETLSAIIRKQCKELPRENGTVPGPKSKTALRVYKHEASGSIILVKNTSPVAFIYLSK